MCGIAGVIRFGNEPIKEEVLSLMLTGNEHRGNDATGIAIAEPNGRVSIFKDDVPAWQFVTSKSYKDFLEANLTPETWAVILHARGASKGNPRVNDNNHPMFAGNCAAIHNGHISNDEFLFNNLKLDRKAETDSDIIRAIGDKWGFSEDAFERWSRMSGSAAGAVLSPAHPRHMVLFRSGSPMMLASTDNFFAFASEKNTLHRAMRPWVERFGMWFQYQKPELAFAPMADNTAWLIGPDGLQTHYPFKTHYGNYVEPFRQTYEKYGERQARFNADLKRVNATPTNKPKKGEAYCAPCRRTWVIPYGSDPTSFFCKSEKDSKDGCGKRLTAKSPLTVMN